METNKADLTIVPEDKKCRTANWKVIEALQAEINERQALHKQLMVIVTVMTIVSFAVGFFFGINLASS